MIALRAGAYVLIDMVAMSLDEAFAVKTEEQSRIAGRGAWNSKYRETGKRKRTYAA